MSAAAVMYTNLRSQGLSAADAESAMRNLGFSTHELRRNVSGVLPHHGKETRNRIVPHAAVSRSDSKSHLRERPAGAVSRHGASFPSARNLHTAWLATQAVVFAVAFVAVATFAASSTKIMFWGAVIVAGLAWLAAFKTIHGWRARRW